MAAKSRRSPVPRGRWGGNTNARPWRKSWSKRLSGRVCSRHLLSTLRGFFSMLFPRLTPLLTPIGMSFCGGVSEMATPSVTQLAATAVAKCDAARLIAVPWLADALAAIAAYIRASEADRQSDGRG